MNEVRLGGDAINLSYYLLFSSAFQKSLDGDDLYISRGMDSFDEESAFPVFFKHSTCYDIMPKSAKLLILDSTLPIRKAIQSLTDHVLDAAPVWSSRLQTYTHLLTQDLCLRLLAQVFPNEKSDSTDGAPPSERNPGADMSYWEGKTLGSVLTEVQQQVVVPPPRHVIIADLAGSGNLLGILTSDRLLAYLRVRMRSLPNPSLLRVSDLSFAVGLIH
ncbi:unnamed protein product [Dibothriocephalus latus]|uniref:CBS domain-containing protein n=1 Tax=Dibothriocephalus latus TaxID=60516 RepID=A0A3P7LZC9_DIBLA|nr:unnamed protein product [Dibothriocephalus latus]